MGENYLYLVCVPCEKEGNKDFQVKVAKYKDFGSLKPFVLLGQWLSDWFEEHQDCGKVNSEIGPTHYRLKFEYEATGG